MLGDYRIILISIIMVQGSLILLRNNTQKIKIGTFDHSFRLGIGFEEENLIAKKLLGKEIQSYLETDVKAIHSIDTMLTLSIFCYVLWGT